MNSLVGVLLGLISSYYMATNYLANQIIDLYTFTPPEEPESGMIIDPEDTKFVPDFAELPSQIRNIPDILLNSLEYQEATVIGGAGLTDATAENPIEAIVNVFCTLSNDEYRRTTTGTGFFIDADGVILTNAHVAQFLLLENSEQFNDAECLIRTGDPATAKYEAELLYISPAWIQENASVLNDQVPLGTGERDYALLYVSETTSGEPLPAAFPALGFDSDLMRTSVKGSEVTAAGYPASELLQTGPETDLIPKQASTTISELYTFGSNYADVFSIRGSEVGAQGASGGPVVNINGDVIGMIATRGDDAIDGVGSLRAITMSHIDRTITEETGFTLQENLGGNLAYRSEIFETTLAPFLLTILEFQNPE